MTHWMEGDWPENLQPEDERDVLLKRLCSEVQKLLHALPSLGEKLDEQMGELELLTDDIMERYEDNDPRSMGWVGDDGLP